MTATIPPRRAGTTRAQLLARLHCIKKELAWSDDEYRDILQQVSGKRSASELDFAGLAKAVAHLGGQHARRSRPSAAPSEWAFIDQAAEYKRPLLRKICMVCLALGVGRNYAEGVAKRHSQGQPRRLEMMSRDELYQVAAALVNTQRHRQSKEVSE